MSEHYVVRVYESELELIAEETLGHQNLETGGSLFGLYGHGGGPTVFLASRPAGEAVKKKTALELDPKVTRLLEEITWKRFGVQCIGMWHSHHWIGLMEPSSGDRERTRRYAERHHRPQYTEILANFVGGKSHARGLPEDISVQLTPFFYLDARQLARAETVIHVLPGMSPLRHALTELRDTPDLREALRPAGRLPRDAYTTAGSSAGSPSSWRRVFGMRTDGAPADDFGEVADDRLDETPSAVPEHSGERPAALEPAPGATSVAEPAEGGSEPSTQVTTGRDQPRLVTIPDIADFIEGHIQPVMRQLPSQYHVELDLIGPDGVALIVEERGRRARLLLLTGWDGKSAVAYGCRVELAGKGQEWPPARRRDRFFPLEEPLRWGLQQLSRL